MFLYSYDIYQKLLVSALHGRYFRGVKRNENKENEYNKKNSIRNKEQHL